MPRPKLTAKERRAAATRSQAKWRRGIGAASSTSNPQPSFVNSTASSITPAVSKPKIEQQSNKSNLQLAPQLVPQFDRALEREPGTAVAVEVKAIPEQELTPNLPTSTLGLVPQPEAGPREDIGGSDVASEEPCGTDADDVDDDNKLRYGFTSFDNEPDDFRDKGEYERREAEIEDQHREVMEHGQENTGSKREGEEAKLEGEEVGLERDADVRVEEGEEAAAMEQLRQEFSESRVRDDRDLAQELGQHLLHFHSCDLEHPSSDEHDVCSQQDRISLAELAVNNEAVPQVLSSPEILSGKSPLRDSQHNWGIAFEAPENSTTITPHVCLSNPEQPYRPSQAQFDIDSFIRFARSFGLCTYGLMINFSPQFYTNIQLNLHLTLQVHTITVEESGKSESHFTKFHTTASAE